MTSYIKKMPVAVAVIFFGVSAGSALFSGESILWSLGKGFIAGAVAGLVGGLLLYVIMEEDIPEPEIPEDLKYLEKTIRKSGE